MLQCNNGADADWWTVYFILASWLAGRDESICVLGVGLYRVVVGADHIHPVELRPPASQHDGTRDSRQQKRHAQ